MALNQSPGRCLCELDRQLRLIGAQVVCINGAVKHRGFANFGGNFKEFFHGIFQVTGLGKVTMKTGKRQQNR